jgi:RNA polymerase sigma factor (sigma-70 family)
MANALQRKINPFGEYALFLPVYRCKRIDDVKLLSLWKSYKIDGSWSAYRALAEYYINGVLNISMGLMRRNPLAFDDLGEMVSAGTEGLFAALEHFDCPTELGHLRQFRKMMANWVKMALFKNLREQVSVYRAKMSGKFRFVEKARAVLTQKLERPPTPEELADAIRAKITNPNVYVHGEIKCHKTGNYQKLAAQRKFNPTEQDDEPADTVITDIRARELKRAIKQLSARDQKIARMVLAGKSVAEIAKKTGREERHTMRSVNGILWVLRSNARLAASYGVKPDEMPEASNRANLPRIWKEMSKHNPVLGTEAFQAKRLPWAWLARVA